MLHQWIGGVLTKFQDKAIYYQRVACIYVYSLYIYIPSFPHEMSQTIATQRPVGHRRTQFRRLASRDFAKKFIAALHLEGLRCQVAT
jgi:hypothetical protein